MKFQQLNFISRRLPQNSSNFATLIFLLCFVIAPTKLALADETFESPDPILISAPDSTRALAINAAEWNGALPKKTTDVFQPGARVVFFVANVELLPDESANAFRIYAEDAAGKQFRLIVEDLRRLKKHNWIYALTARLYDPTGYNDQPAANGDVLIRISWRGNTSNRVCLGLGTTGGKIKDDVGAVPTPATTVRQATVAERSVTTGGDRKRFSEQSTFGFTPALDLRLRQIGLRRWIDEQINKPYPTIPRTNHPLVNGDSTIACGGVYGTNPEINRCHRDLGVYPIRNWMVKEALYGDDQLRRRVSWALHQIWVVANPTVYQNRWLQEYVEILDNNAFGNYRTLMKEMTLSPAMGEYLDMVRSTRTNPNENYPRELLQLFTIGLYELNQDGTFKLDNQGNRTPTYDQDKVDQFTKVFTGWVRCENGAHPACPNAVSGAPNFVDPMYLAFPSNHDQTQKVLFNYPGAPHSTIPACTNCTTDANRIAYANASLDQTLDNIFHHPNVGPFISKLLIQHLVTSDPTPAYVARVAAAFNNNGSGVRGDMKAVVKAVLLDPEARGSRKTEPTYGKLREPLQYLTNFLRAFNVRAGNRTIGNVPATPPVSCEGRSDGAFDWIPREMGQDLWSSPTVFNYFPPDYVIPGTDILGPEFALANTGSSFARNNYIHNFVFGSEWLRLPTAEEPYPYAPCGTSIDLSEPTAWAAADPTGNLLIENLNTKLMHGTMSEAMKSKIRPALNFNVSAEAKAKQALMLVASSSQYQIQR